MSVYSGNLEC